MKLYHGFDICQEAIPVFHKEIPTKVPVNGFKDETKRVNIPVYSIEDKRNSLEAALGNPRQERRLVAVLIAKDYFPATDEFKERHSSKMDKKLFLY